MYSLLCFGEGGTGVTDGRNDAVLPAVADQGMSGVFLGCQGNDADAVSRGCAVFFEFADIRFLDGGYGLGTGMFRIDIRSFKMHTQNGSAVTARMMGAADMIHIS